MFDLIKETLVRIYANIESYLSTKFPFIAYNIIPITFLERKYLMLISRIFLLLRDERIEYSNILSI